MADTKTVDGVVIPLNAVEQIRIDALRVLQTARENRTDDKVAEQDFPLGLSGFDSTLRAALEAIALQTGFTLATFRAAIKAQLIAKNFYK